jgi:AraC family transcriptional regulator, transcriptional activator of pobA
MKTPAVHSYVALAVHTSGRMRVEHHGDFDLGPGDMHLVPAGDMHRALSAQRAEMWGLAFCRTCLDPMRYRDLLAPFDRVRQGAAPVVRLPAARQQYVLDLLGELSREHSAGAPMPVVAESLLALVLAEVARASSTSAPIGPPSIVGEALAYIEGHCLGPLSLTEVARAVRRSPAYLTTTVKQATGRTVVEWIIEGRMAEARRRLLDTDEYVDVISERVGYADASHFVRLFRRLHGVAPAAWRAKQRMLPSRA